MASRTTISVTRWFSSGKAYDNPVVAWGAVIVVFFILMRACSGSSGGGATPVPYTIPDPPIVAEVVPQGEETPTWPKIETVDEVTEAPERHHGANSPNMVT